MVGSGGTEARSGPRSRGEQIVQFSEQGTAALAEVRRFMDDHVYPHEREYAEQLEQVGPTG